VSQCDVKVTPGCTFVLQLNRGVRTRSATRRRCGSGGAGGVQPAFNSPAPPKGGARQAGSFGLNLIACKSSNLLLPVAQSFLTRLYPVTPVHTGQEKGCHLRYKGSFGRRERLVERPVNAPAAGTGSTGAFPRCSRNLRCRTSDAGT
jgi:hypothetical protein